MALLAVVAGLLVGCGEDPEARWASEPSQLARLEVDRLDPPAPPGSLAPELAADAGGGVLLSWLEGDPSGDGHRLRFSRLGEEGWTQPRTVVEGTGFFANWADRPGLVETGEELVAHWLWKTAPDAYAYEIRMARSRDGGGSWERLGPLHHDGTPTEHGFVSYVATPSGARVFWLDGRAMVEDGPMTLRTGVPAGDGGQVLDSRVCECCSTDAALTSRGPLVVYRDRSPDEVRDIAVVRWSDGGWSGPVRVHEDGWRIDGCPVNGPAVDARGERVAVAWFTAGGVPRVQVAFSDDAGESFSSPVEVDAGAPLGRVDLVLLADGAAVVSWLESGGEAATLLLRRVDPAGAAGRLVSVARTGAGRASGVPRLARRGEHLALAWVESDDGTPGEIRFAMVDPARL